jgi:hypothetical protein
VANNVGVTNRGFEYIAQYLNGANPGSTSYPQPKYIGWGTANGSNATSVIVPAAANQYSDVGPVSELTETRATGAGSVTNAVAASTFATYVLTGTLTASVAENPAESFVCMTATKPFTMTLGVGASLTNIATAFTATSLSGIPATPFYMQLNNEVIEVTSSASTVATIVRGQNGSSAVACATGAVATLGNIPGAGITNPNNGDMLAHAGFVALSLNTSDSIAFTWNINIAG